MSEGIYTKQLPLQWKDSNLSVCLLWLFYCRSIAATKQYREVVFCVCVTGSFTGRMTGMQHVSQTGVWVSTTGRSPGEQTGSSVPQAKQCMLGNGAESWTDTFLTEAANCTSRVCIKKKSSALLVFEMSAFCWTEQQAITHTHGWPWTAAAARCWDASAQRWPPCFCGWPSGSPSFVCPAAWKTSGNVQNNI